MSLPFDAPVFAVEDREYTWADVIAAARAGGEWGRLEARARTGILAARAARDAGELPPEAQLERVRADFRYSRNLLAAEEAAAWLERHGLTVEEWAEWTLRTVVREQRASQSGAVGTRDSSYGLDLEAATWTEAVCSGELERLAFRLAERVAVYARVRGEAPAPKDVGELDRVHDEFARRAVTPASIERALAARMIEWTRLECVCLSTPDELVAREAALCVRADGSDLTDVAAAAGGSVDRSVHYLDGTAGPQLTGALMGARPGDLIGPLERAGEFLLCAVVERVPPKVTDPEIRERVERALGRRAVADEVVRRVRWRWPLAERRDEAADG